MALPVGRWVLAARGAWPGSAGTRFPGLIGHGRGPYGHSAQVGKGIELDSIGRQFEPGPTVGAIVAWPGILFRNSRGNKAAATLRLCVVYVKKNLQNTVLG